MDDYCLSSKSRKRTAGFFTILESRRRLYPAKLIPSSVTPDSSGSLSYACGASFQLARLRSYRL